MENLLSPTQQFFNFDLTDNFELSTDDFYYSPKDNSPMLDDLMSCQSSNNGSEPAETKMNHYTHESTISQSLWSSIEELAHQKVPPTLSCIDTFIKDPSSDLAQLVQQCKVEQALFDTLIVNSLTDQVALNQQNHYLQQLQKRQNFGQLPFPSLPQHPLDVLPQQQHSTLEHHLNSLPPPPKKKKTSNATPKRVSKSSSYSSNNSNYTHSDSVNAQLLRELIRQAGRNSRHGSMDSSNSSMTSHSSNMMYCPPAIIDYRKEVPYQSGNYTSTATRHHPYPRVPYHIQTKKASTKPVPQKNFSSRPSNKSMGRPSMYSSDISQAQLLEIQAISRAQQDFIRAREQQEAEKEMLKHQKKQGF